MILAPTLTLSAGSGAAIVRPTFSRDFAGEKTLNNGTGPAITFTRASNATFFNASGTLQTASNDQPRFDHSSTGSSLGLLIEESRTNSIRNSQAGGAASGSAGTAPTNWPWTGSTAGLTRTITAGSTGGFNYLDVKFAGTPTSSFQIVLDAESPSQVTAAAAQAWTMSAYIAIIAGSAPDCVIGIREAIADGTFVVSSQTNIVSSLTSSLRRFSHTRTLTDATTARVNGTIRVNATNGVALDFTLRIAAPQLEQGAFPTSYIPTTTAAATRSADSAVVTPISGFYNQSEGTLFAEASRYQVASGGQLFGFRDTDTNLVSIIYGIGVPTQMRFDVLNTTTQAQLSTSTSAVSGTTYKHGAAYAVNDFEYYVNGTRTGTGDQFGTLPSVTTMAIGAGRNTSGGTFGQNNGHIRRIAYYPRRLSNTLLQQLTT